MDANYLTVPEVAEALRVTSATVRNWIEGGVLPGYRFGSSLRVERAEFDAFVQRSRIHA